MGARPRNRWPWLLVSLALGCSSSNDDKNPLPVEGDGDSGACASHACRDAGSEDAALPQPLAGTGGSGELPMAGMMSTPMNPPVPICTPQVPLVPMCAGCACVALPTCAEAITGCDESCWSLLACGYERCLTTFEAECLERECPDRIDALMPALAANPCTSRCYGACLNDIRRLGMDEMDAGL